MLPDDLLSILSDYSNIKLSCQSGPVSIVEGTRKETNTREMIHITPLSSPQMVRYLKKEFEICAADPHCTIHAIDSGPQGPYWLQRFSNHGMSFYKKFVNSRPYLGGPEGLDVIVYDLPPIIHRDRTELLNVLEAMCGLCTEVQKLHDARFIHNSINPFVVYIHDKVTLHGNFILQSMDHDEDEFLYGQNLLPYLSPESSGRTSRSPDHRSDIYSMGCTLFELIIGRPPYLASDPLTYIHRHLTAKPPLINKISSDLPVELGMIISKCLEKSPDARYQSAVGLRYDLEQVCLSLRGSAQSFEIGSLDKLLKLRPTELVGREREVALLQSVMSQVKQNGKSQVILLTGPSGVGKSRLASCLVDKSVMYSAAKYEQYGSYYALTTTLQNLVRQLLTQNTQYWKHKLLKNLPAVAVLSTNVPELLGLGISVEPAPEVSVQEASRRFHSAVVWLLQVLSHKSSLLIVQDDIQYGAQAELDLIAEIAVSVPRLLLILTRRENEAVDVMFASLTCTKQEIPVRNLEETQVTQMICHALHNQTSNEITALSRYIYSKTSGNPFFVGQLLNNLHRTGKVFFQVDGLRWRFNLKAISEAELTEDIVDVIVSQLRSLNQKVQKLLISAAALGQQRLTIDFLAAATDLRVDDVRNYVNVAIDHNILKLDGEHIQFVHERTQEACYSLAEQSECAQIHLSMAKNLLKHNLDHAFVLANQFNRCLKLLSSSELITALECNLKAGSRALELSDAVSSLYYYEVAEQV